MKEVSYIFLDGSGEDISMKKEELENFIKAWNEGEMFGYETEDEFVYVDTSAIMRISVSKEEENE